MFLCCVAEIFFLLSHDFPKLSIDSNIKTQNAWNHFRWTFLLLQHWILSAFSDYVFVFCFAWLHDSHYKKIYDDFVNVLLVFWFCLLRKCTIFYFRNQGVQADVFFAWPSLYSCEGHHSLLFKTSTTITIFFFLMLSCYMEINAFICRILRYAMGNIFQ